MRHALSISTIALIGGLAFAAAGYAQIEKTPTGCTASCQTVGSTYSCNAEGASAECKLDRAKNQAICTDGTKTTTCECAGATAGCTTK